MYGRESHDGLLCKISNLHSLREGQKLQGGAENPPTPHPSKKKTWRFILYILKAQYFTSVIINGSFCYNVICVVCVFELGTCSRAPVGKKNGRLMQKTILHAMPMCRPNQFFKARIMHWLS